MRAQILGDELLQLPVRFDAFAQEFDAFSREQSVRTANLEERVGRVENDMGTLKGDFARTLSARELGDMAGSNLPRDTHRSFRNADLVIEATDGTDARYIAMEISFTADRRDCDRAIRNTDLITRFTGQPSQAAVDSARNDREATEAVESGAVHWHPP